jgi:hypothetical protein
MIDRDIASILYFVSSIVIVVGLPTGFYVAFRMLDLIDRLKYASSDIGEEFMRGLQNGVNRTFINDLTKQIAQTIIDNSIENTPPNI